MKADAYVFPLCGALVRSKVGLEYAYLSNANPTAIDTCLLQTEAYLPYDIIICTLNLILLG